ncbi:Cytosol aminopeptidase, catalytic domain, partial [Nowakowskiella sp. JEL0078]
DTADVRIFYNLARKAIVKAVSCGSKNPVLWVSGGDLGDFKRVLEIALLGIFQEIYIPLQAREWGVKLSLESIGVVGVEQSLLNKVIAIEVGKVLARDIGGADPERMAPKKCAGIVVTLKEIIRKEFENTGFGVEIVYDFEVLKSEYPLLAAVSRASMPVSYHQPCVIKLEYRSNQQELVEENLFLIGKGVTYDTGGADLKYGGVMRGMSRDKCGASGTAGFMRALSNLKPKNINATAYLAFVRNSIGSASYVSDEIITSRAGVRVHVANTDAEGRMKNGKIYYAKKETVTKNKLKNARLFTIATLTGYVIRAYDITQQLLISGQAKKLQISQRIAEGGNQIGDPFEISTLRRDDFDFVASGSNTEDVVQVNDKPSSGTARGHQFPAAFLLIASGIHPHHSRDSDFPISYTHLDIAGSAEEPSGVGLSLPKVTGSPVAALV